MYSVREIGHDLYWVGCNDRGSKQFAHFLSAYLYHSLYKSAFFTVPSFAIVTGTKFSLNTGSVPFNIASLYTTFSSSGLLLSLSPAVAFWYENVKASPPLQGNPPFFLRRYRNAAWQG